MRNNQQAPTTDPRRKAVGGHALKDAAHEGRVFRARAAFSAVCVAIAFTALLARFFYLQVLEHDAYRTQSESNRVKLRALAPNRGLIFDRNGRLLAENRPAYRLEIVPEQVEAIDETVAALADLIAISEDDVERFSALRRHKRGFEGVPIRFQLSEREVARFAVNRHRFPGVEVTPDVTRYYPMAGSFAHVLGYVARVGPEDLARVERGRYSATSHIGKTGVERAFEDALHGQVGHERVEVNAEGRVLRVLQREPPIPGDNLYLTLDAGLQVAAQEAMGAHTGAVVALDPRNGDVLAMVSMPSYDPNPFVQGVSAEHYRDLQTSPDDPLFNRVLRGRYPPGSTIKPMVALAGLETGTVGTEQSKFCTGAYRLPGRSRQYRCWKRVGHGEVDLHRAIVESCDVYFYDLAVEMGITALHDYLSRFGLGTPTGIPLRGEVGGVLPSPAWKREARGLPWFPGETVIAGIGQGFMVTTPVQLAAATATLANRGRSVRPRLVRSVQPAGDADLRAQPSGVAEESFAQEPEHWQAVIEAMRGVVHGPHGTARSIGDTNGYRMAGKTGTAQVFGLRRGQQYEAEELPEHLRDHALFVAFAPLERPRIAVAVIAEHSGSGSKSAAPIARRVIDAYMGDGR